MDVLLVVYKYSRKKRWVNIYICKFCTIWCSSYNTFKREREMRKNGSSATYVCVALAGLGG
jgi:hypothetical protein